MDKEKILDIEKLANKKYKHLISYAVWDFGKDSVEIDGQYYDPSVEKLQNPSKYREFFEENPLKTDYVIMGLNYATFKAADKDVDGYTIPDYANFHLIENKDIKGEEFYNPYLKKKESKKIHMDQKLGLATYETPAWGSLMLDLMCVDEEGRFLGYPESKINVAEKRLRDPLIALQQITGVLTILREYEIEDPKILALGVTVNKYLIEHYSLLLKVLGNNTRVIEVPHYSNARGIPKTDYINKVIHYRTEEFKYKRELEENAI